MAAFGFYVGTLGNDVAGLTEIAWFIVFSLLLTFWLNSEPGSRSLGFDWPAWFFIFWPLVLPYYFFKTRGWEGLILYVGVGTLYNASVITNYYGYWYFFE